MISLQCFSRVAKIFKMNISSIKLRYKRFICIKMLLSIYIYKTESFETPTIFHVSTIFKLNFPSHHCFPFPMQIRLLAK